MTGVQTCALPISTSRPRVLGGELSAPGCPARRAEDRREETYPGEALDTTVLVEQGGKTTVTTTVLYESQEVCDAVLKSPMELEVAESYDKLAEVLASIS